MVSPCATSWQPSLWYNQWLKNQFTTCLTLLFLPHSGCWPGLLDQELTCSSNRQKCCQYWDYETSQTCSCSLQTMKQWHHALLEHLTEALTIKGDFDYPPVPESRHTFSQEMCWNMAELTLYSAPRAFGTCNNEKSVKVLGVQFILFHYW